MERLTERDGLLVHSKLSGEFGSQTILQALADYEDLEEQVLKSTGTDLASMVGEFMHYYNLKKENRLLELPCKVGDTVYLVDYEENTYDEGIVNKVYVDSDGICIDSDYEIGTCVESDYVFFTEEEAEKALAEMEK